MKPGFKNWLVSVTLPSKELRNSPTKSENVFSYLRAYVKEISLVVNDCKDRLPAISR